MCFIPVFEHAENSTLAAFAMVFFICSYSFGCVLLAFRANSSSLIAQLSFVTASITSCHLSPADWNHRILLSVTILTIARHPATTHPSHDTVCVAQKRQLFMKSFHFLLPWLNNRTATRPILIAINPWWQDSISPCLSCFRGCQTNDRSRSLSVAITQDYCQGSFGDKLILDKAFFHAVFSRTPTECSKNHHPAKKDRHKRLQHPNLVKNRPFIHTKGEKTGHSPFFSTIVGCLTTKISRLSLPTLTYLQNFMLTESYNMGSVKSSLTKSFRFIPESFVVTILYQYQ